LPAELDHAHLPPSQRAAEHLGNAAERLVVPLAAAVGVAAEAAEGRCVGILRSQQTSAHSPTSVTGLRNHASSPPGYSTSPTASSSQRGTTRTRRPARPRPWPRS